MTFDPLVLPHVNAALNATCAVLLVSGWAAIRTRRIALHKALMVAAFAVSVLFLASYLTYHFHVPSKKFTGEGGVRIFYYGMLLTHTVLAAAVPFLAVFTLVQGFRDRLASHVRVARWTLPIWLYVSVTGVGVYLMLYHFFPSPARA